MGPDQLKRSVPVLLDVRSHETANQKNFSSEVPLLGVALRMLAEREGFEPSIPISRDTRFPIVLLRPARTPLRLVHCSRKAKDGQVKTDIQRADLSPWNQTQANHVSKIKGSGPSEISVLVWGLTPAGGAGSDPMVYKKRG
jgi:hypothetical protein